MARLCVACAGVDARDGENASSPLGVAATSVSACLLLLQRAAHIGPGLSLLRPTLDSRKPSMHDALRWSLRGAHVLYRFLLPSVTSPFGSSSSIVSTCALCNGQHGASGCATLLHCTHADVRRVADDCCCRQRRR